jgi:hypothetical protein
MLVRRKRCCFEIWNGDVGKSRRERGYLKAGTEVLVKAEWKEALLKAGTEMLVKAEGKEAVLKAGTEVLV